MRDVRCVYNVVNFDWSPSTNNRFGPTPFSLRTAPFSSAVESSAPCYGKMTRAPCSSAMLRRIASSLTKLFILIQAVRQLSQTALEYSSHVDRRKLARHARQITGNQEIIGRHQRDERRACLRCQFSMHGPARNVAKENL